MSFQTWLLVGIITGTIGTAWFVYGKKQQRLDALLTGVVLCIYPYFIHSLVLMILIGVVLTALPFFIRVDL